VWKFLPVGSQAKFCLFSETPYFRGCTPFAAAAAYLLAACAACCVLALLLL
jgi:hypothetical protein